MGNVVMCKVVTTYASLTGWVAVFEGRAVNRVWSLAQGLLHVLELYTVLLALKHFLI